MAVAKVQAVDSRFREADVIRAVDSVLPDYLGGLDAAQVEELVRGIAAESMGEHCTKLTADAPALATLPAAERLANGASSHQRPNTDLYASNDHLKSERGILAALLAYTRWGAAVPLREGVRVRTGPTLPQGQTPPATTPKGQGP